jgi:hypothetical protein
VFSVGKKNGGLLLHHSKLQFLEKDTGGLFADGSVSPGMQGLAFSEKPSEICQLLC